ncbi:MAG: NAD-dependent epimerase/dehydratase family protein [Coprococcus sp.]
MMKDILITGGTVFVSRYVAEYFAKKGNNVFVLNRNTRLQSDNVTLIEGDRNHLGDTLKGYKFDVVLDITAYTANDIKNLINALGDIKEYIFVSSSAVYPETLEQPFREEQQTGYNSIWGDYGMNKVRAEQYLLKQVPQAYILRPPYLYGPMQNIYRELFVFDCAMEKRPFYIPKDGSMKLQFFHVEDLCRFIEIILEKKPKDHIFNVGNPKEVSINEWVKLCYEAVGTELTPIYVDDSYEQRSYFCFYDYEYYLDVERQQRWIPDTKDLLTGLKESYEWYSNHKVDVTKKPYLEYIEKSFKR